MQLLTPQKKRTLSPHIFKRIDLIIFVLSFSRFRDIEAYKAISKINKQRGVFYPNVISVLFND